MIDSNDPSPFPIYILVRSFERPECLQRTLRSILLADVDLCAARYVYDDGSTSDETLRVLSDEGLINRSGKEFEVVRGENCGCRRSFVMALEHLKGVVESNAFIITVDNDVVVKPNFVSALVSAHSEAVAEYGTHRVLLTGFNPTNAHRNSIGPVGQNAAYYRKRTCGGINYAFHRTMIDFIAEQWKRDNDWGVCKQMYNLNIPLLCLKRSVVNHIGVRGLHSRDARYDVDDRFDDVS